MLAAMTAAHLRGFLVYMMFICKVYFAVFTCIYVLLQVNGKYIVKSGTDFRSFGKITLTFDECGKLSVAVKKIDIVSSIEEDTYIRNIVSEYIGNFTVFLKIVTFIIMCEYFVSVELSFGFCS